MMIHWEVTGCPGMFRKINQYQRGRCRLFVSIEFDDVALD